MYYQSPQDLYFSVTKDQAIPSFTAAVSSFTHQRQMITILYFGEIRERIGITSEVVKPQPFASLVEHLKQKHNITQSMISLNEEYVYDYSVELKDGDTIAFIPPLSGG